MQQFTAIDFHGNLIETLVPRQTSSHVVTE
jgi:hypothetical protein